MLILLDGHHKTGASLDPYAKWLRTTLTLLRFVSQNQTVQTDSTSPTWSSLKESSYDCVMWGDWSCWCVLHLFRIFHLNWLPWENRRSFTSFRIPMGFRWELCTKLLRSQQFWACLDIKLLVLEEMLSWAGRNLLSCRCLSTLLHLALTCKRGRAKCSKAASILWL